MYDDGWRQLLYPLGFVAMFFFSARFVWQWLLSEWSGRCVVPRSFWHCSLLGHLLLTLHSCVQLQFHVGFFQVANGVIAWRNLNLTGSPQRRLSTAAACWIMAAALLSLTLFFLWQWLWRGDVMAALFRTPALPWSDAPASLAWYWHLFGSAGLALFGSRFWLQWWHAERHQSSSLPPLFWWLSFVGNSMMLLYFALLGDLVNFIGPLFGTAPYLRNIMLLRKAHVPKA